MHDPSRFWCMKYTKLQGFDSFVHENRSEIFMYAYNVEYRPNRNKDKLAGDLATAISRVESMPSHQIT